MKIGMRKFVFVMFSLLLGCLLAYFGKLDTVIRDLIVYLCGIYVLGNVGAKFAEKFSNKTNG